MTKQQLLNFGFIEFENHPLKPRADAFLQFAVREHGPHSRIKFFINAYFYGDEHEYEVHFTKTGETFNVGLFYRPTHTPEYLVSWFHHLWVILGADYYNG